MAANWLIIAGFVLLIVGSALRVAMMMRSSDATPEGARVLHGRELLRQYRAEFPRSMMPLLTRSTVISGVVLLLAGLAVEFSR
jgi:hypothetical protein